AGLFTASAGLSTYTAMFVHFGVFFALGGTFRTRDATRFQHCLHGGQITAGAPTEQVTSRGPHIGAVYIEANAVAQLGDHLLAQTGISTGGAGLGAFETCSNTVRKLGYVKITGGIGVSFNHRGDMAHGSRPPTTQRFHSSSREMTR